MYEGKENFKIATHIFIEALNGHNIPDLKGVLREVQGSDGEAYHIAANGASSILLRMGSFDDKPTLEEIKASIVKWSKEEAIEK